MGQELSGSYNASLTLLSFGVAVLVSYAAFDLGKYVRSPAMGQSYLLISHLLSRRLWLLGSTLALGIGIWSIHFIAMLAFQIPLAVSYDRFTTLLSLGSAIVASGAALWLLSRPRINSVQWIGGGSLMGVAIASMHYIGRADVDFVHLNQLPELMPMLDQPWLAVCVGIATFSLLGLALLASRLRQYLFHQLVQQQSLQESENRLQMLIQNMHVGVLLLNAKAEILLANQAAIDLLGLPSEPTQQSFHQIGQFFHEDETPFAITDLPVQQAIARKQPIRETVMGLTLSSGKVQRWLLVNTEPQLLEGAVKQVICTLSDITQQKLTEATLQQNRELFFKAFHSNPVASCITTLKDGIFLDVNDSFLKLFGYEREAVIDHTSIELALWVNQSDRDHCIQTLQRQSSLQMDIPFRTGSGEIREGIISMEQIDLRGESCLLTMVYDITERKQVEAAQMQQVKWSALRAAIGTALTEGDSLQDILGRCAIALHQHLDAAFARIWIVNPVEQVLELQASAGLYSHLGGPHSRIPIGQFKIGWIAQHRQPHLSNQIADDPRISDPEWARREGIVAFAGYPLTIRDRVVGVMAIFAQQPLTDKTLEEMASAASSIAVGIDRKLAEDALRKTAAREHAIARVVQRMRQTLDLETIFRTTTEELRQAIHCDRVLIYRFNPDWSGEFLAESVAAGWLALISEPPSSVSPTVLNSDRCTVRTWTTTVLLESDPCFREDTYLQETQGGPYRQGVPYRSVNDIYTADFTSCYVELLEQCQARAYIAAPIFLDIHLWGLLVTYQNSGPRQWDDAEIRIVTQIGTQLGVAVKQAELLAQTQQQSNELRTAKEAADAANRAKSEFLANMSHELRTPLNAILGFTQLMQRDTGLTEDHREYINIISNSGEHLLVLINDILEMSKIEAGKITLQEDGCNLDQLLKSLEEMLRFKAEAKGLQLIVDRSPDLPRLIIVDENKLRQVLINLLGNAIKFTQAGKVILRIGLRQLASEAEDPSLVLWQDVTPTPTYRLWIEIQDTGFGIAADELDRLFEPFTQTAIGLNSREGTGLGLPISQKFVQLMGGCIAVQSELGVGSQFSFEIPVQLLKRNQPEEQPVRQRKAISLAPNQPQYRLLVVDDSPTNRIILVKFLNSLGFVVQEAENGAEAIDRWRDWQPHLIWMDMRMPIMNGYEATQQIKASLQGQATVVIALTASAFEEQRQQILLTGCDDFVRKPFRESEILEKLTEHLGVQYLYEDSDNEVKPPCSLKSKIQYASHLAPEAFQSMPKEWVQQLHYAAAQGNDWLLTQLTHHIPPENRVFLDGLMHLIENLQFEQIMELAQPVLAEATVIKSTVTEATEVAITEVAITEVAEATVTKVAEAAITESTITETTIAEITFGSSTRNEQSPSEL